MKKLVVVAILALGVGVGVADELRDYQKSTNINDLFGEIKEFQTEKTTKVQSSGKKQKELYNKFLGAVERKLHKNWNLYERSGNFAADVKYQIDSNGYFRYTSVTKSGNAEFDTKVLDFLSTLEGKYIAVPPNKKVFKGSVRLSDEVMNFDKFLNAVGKRLHDDWNLYAKSGNFVAEVKYQIDGNGFFHYTSVTKSGNAKFDTKVLHFLSALEGRYIAVPPNKKAYKGSVRLIDEISKDKR